MTCTDAMKGQTIHHRDYEAAKTEKDGFALWTIIEGISIGIEGRHNMAVLATIAEANWLPWNGLEQAWSTPPLWRRLR